MGGRTGRRKGAKNYKNEVLIRCVRDILPNGKYGWQAVTLAHQEATQEDEVRNNDDLKKHWIKICAMDGMQKPTGRYYSFQINLFLPQIFHRQWEISH
jgi:hypothetical protein